jgi:hypothetical protein
MRKDEKGDPCPETLGEYRDLCNAFAPGSKAVEFLDSKISEQGRDEVVIAADSQMRLLLMPMLLQKGENVSA